MTLVPPDSPNQLFLTYVLYSYSDFKLWSVPDRLRARFLFEQFCAHLISPAEFHETVARLGTALTCATEILINATQRPDRVLYCPGSYHWSREETLILLAGYANGCLEDVVRLLPHRSYKSCQHRIAQVRKELEKANVMREPSWPIESPKVSTHVQCESCSIRDVEELVLQNQIAEQRRRACAAKLMRMSKNYQRRLRALRAKTALTTRRLREAQRYIQQITVHDDVSDDDVDCDSSLSGRLLQECESFRSAGRRQYSQFLLEISQLLASTSPKTYRLIRQLLPLPSSSCLSEHFSATVSHVKSSLVEGANVLASVREFAPSRRLGDDPIVATIGIDAFAFRTFTGTTMSSTRTSQDFSNAFVFLEIPLDSRYPPKVLHIEPRPNGSYDQSIDTKFREIREALMRYGHNVWFKATDGDPYLNREHKPFYKKYLKGRTKHDFNLARSNIFTALQEGVVMPISDPLHFAKNLRGRLLDHHVAVTLGMNEKGPFAYTTTAKELEDLLHVGDPLTDVSQIGRMRDVYVTKLFTLENVHNLLINKAYSAALLFLPYSCLFTMLYSENLSNESRVFLVSLAYYSCLRLYKEGKIRAIGVSNFNSSRLMDLCYNADIAPAVNQIERHPFYQRSEELAVMKELGVQAEAWAPFAEGMNGMFTQPVLQEIAAAYGKSVAQVILRWEIQSGLPCIAKSVRPERIRENFAIWDFELTADEMKRIAALDLGRPQMLDTERPSEVKRVYDFLNNPVVTSLHE